MRRRVHVEGDGVGEQIVDYDVVGPNASGSDYKSKAKEVGRAGGGGLIRQQWQGPGIDDSGGGQTVN
ncbi:hypothetical protein Q3G72_002210 [Acer saccharum]|nr:hypothetical protein Q3G72_002210 [Acer saccharum]